MRNDEHAIRELVQNWLDASRKGDTEGVLKLMADDVLFMVPGGEPFGKEAFAAGSRLMKDIRIEGSSDIIELKIVGDWAWMRNRLHIKITPPDGKTVVRSGYTLTILRKNSDGQWVLYRDANLLGPQQPESSDN